MTRSIDRIVLLALLTVAGCSSGTLEFSDARVRTVIPGQDRTAAYFTVHNGGSAAVVITGASAPGVRTVEMHVTRHEDGMARMRRLDEVVIAPGDTVRFEPGARHLMLFGVSGLGDVVEITLTTRSGGEFRVPFETVAPTDG